ncbi:response regulator [Fulvivirgaceae bacterium BMA12]|uniref:Response regulator n=1 Tax=Agaribacillus aureus TaxID=3051825 RepID=A0ABT8LGH2_9BACT|nr:response regulator [Fulvivirgaceae bacterium BMA12]
MLNTKILVADDTVTMRLIVSQLLKGWNYDYTIVADGLEALKKLNTERFDLILMDLDMPVMDGITATKKIRNHTDENTRNIPIIAISFSITRENRAELLALGMNDCLSKPINPAILKTKIEQYLKKVG